jgi:hypothetical protein
VAPSTTVNTFVHYYSLPSIREEELGNEQTDERGLLLKAVASIISSVQDAKYFFVNVLIMACCSFCAILMLAP